MWSTKKLELCLESIIDYRGKSIPKCESGIQLITARNVRDGKVDLEYKEFISYDIYDSWMDRGIPKAGDILFTTEAPLGMVAPYPNKGRFALGQRLVGLRANEIDLHSGFLLQYLRSPFGQNSIFTLATGSTAIGIRQSELRKLQIPLPPIEEQRKIAEILGTWDAAIAKAERLVEALKLRKKALMQRLLTGEVRFPGFEDEWEEVALGEVFKRVQRQVPADIDQVLSISAKIGFVDQASKFGKIIAGKSLERYTLLKKGEFAYNKGNSTTFPQGCIYRLDEFDVGAVPNVYYCFSINHHDIFSDFYKFYFESGALNRQLIRLINSGVRNDGLLNLSAEEFFQVKIILPSKSEQLAMASIFSTADQELVIAHKQLTYFQQQKRGLMQRLLSGELRVSTEPQAEELLPA